MKLHIKDRVSQLLDQARCRLAFSSSVGSICQGREEDMPIEGALVKSSNTCSRREVEQAQVHYDLEVLSALKLHVNSEGLWRRQASR